jgi:hypothetical protein
MLIGKEAVMTDQCQQGSDGKAVIPPREIIPDAERSAFGLGWEHRRRFLPMSDNPFPVRSLKWTMYRDGWLGKRERELQKQLLAAKDTEWLPTTE